MSLRPRYSVVVPVYLNADTLAALCDRLDGLASGLDGPMEAVFVVDGSPDASLVVLRRLLAERRRFSAQLIVLSRNFGSFSAIRAGLAAAEGPMIAVTAADLQEPVDLLERFFAELSAGTAEIAVGVRESRGDPRRSRAAASLYWRLYRRFVQPDMPGSGVDVFACTRQVVAELLRIGESHTSLVGLLLWLGFRRVEVPYARAARYEGRSGWSLRRRARYLLDSVYSFTDLPVHLITGIGVMGVLASALVAAVVTVAWAVGAIAVAGYTPLMLALAFATSAILLSLGIIGSYVWRTYENTKGRPHAIPMSVERFPGEG